MSSGSDPLISPSFLFHFAASCRRKAKLWSNGGVKLDRKHTLPSFGELEGQPIFADVRAAWSEEGLAFTVRVAGKKQPPWCRSTRLEESDGLRLYIDTRGVHNIHRARRFTHQFLFTPLGGGARVDQPIGRLIPIRRANEQPKPVDPELLKLHSRRHPDGYTLELFLPAETLTGYSPDDHPTLGFCYWVMDRELGDQTFNVSREFPFSDDPSLWGKLELQK